MNLLKRLLNRFLVISLSGILIIILGIGAVGLFTVELPQTQAAATGLQYSTDPNTSVHGIYGPNPVIHFNDPVGTWFRVCNGGCTGYAQSYVQPQQYGGFKWIFDNAGHGNVLEAQPQSGTGNSSCTMQIVSGYRYCGVGIPDDDGDGVPNIADACPSQGNAGYGVGANGCPNPPPPATATPIPPTQPPSLTPVPPQVPPPPQEPIVDGDDDNDGVPNSRDECRNQGDAGYGVNAQGCPNSPPPPPSDSDGDGTPNDRDRCPDVRGSSNNQGCPYIPSSCQIAFLGPTIHIRSRADINAPSEFIRSYENFPLTVIGAVTNQSGETWYQLEGAIPLYVRADVVLLGQPCAVVASTVPSTTVIETLPPTPTEATTIREIPPDILLADLGCAIQPGESIDEAILALIVEAPDPCRAKGEFNYRPNLISYVESAKNYFDDDSEKQRFFDTLLTCNTTIVEWVIQWASSDENKGSLERLMQNMSGDVCANIDTWRNTPQIPLPPNTPPQEAISIGIIICSNPQLTEDRYRQLRQQLVDIWGISINEINCNAINSANRIYIPTPNQSAIYAKLKECQVPNPLSQLEILIMTNNEFIDTTVDCDVFIEKLTCENCAPIELPDELRACVLNSDDEGLMSLFVKNHLPLLRESEIYKLYHAINPCHAVVDYLNTGIIQQPIVFDPPDNNIPEPTPEITPIVTTNTPVEDEIGDETTLIPQEILLELGFDKPRGNDIELTGIGVIYMRNNAIFIREKGLEKEFDDDVIGEKYNPILFTVNNRRLIAYIVVNDGEARIRIVNLNTNDSTFAKLSDLVTPYHLAQLAYNGSLLVFTGIDPNGQYNLYGIPFSATHQNNTAVMLVSNAMNATAIEGLSAFVFEQPNSENSIYLWIPGRQAISPLDVGISGACFSPVGEQFGGKWRFWFLCDGLEAPVLYVRDMQAREPHMYDINGIMPSKNPLTSISLGELQGELFLEDGQMVYWYHKRDKTEKVVRFINGASAIYTFSRE